ncbi:MAG TPA: helix-turn-helix transcriptional regulator [Thermoanaerobaculia bacterium]|nr:helix-turn-helix transcriptional regulator [Thermoanaerobaculia bacterium]
MARNERAEPELIRGAGATAVLALLEDEERYGYQLAEELAATSDGFLDLGQATLYPLLYNLEAKGWIAARWQVAESGRRRKYYRLTARGRRRLERSRDQWRRLVAALGRLRVLGSESG